MQKYIRICGPFTSEKIKETIIKEAQTLYLQEENFT